MSIPTYKNGDDVNVNGKSSGCSDFVRRTLKALKKDEFVLVADLTSAWSTKMNRTKKEVGPQIRQTAERIGRLSNINTNNGKRTIVYKA